MISATFVMEQHIGHRAYYENLRRFVDSMADIRARWVEVTYESSTSLWTQLPFLSAHLRGSLVGREQVRQGLRQQSADVALFNTQVPAALAGNLVKKQPYVLTTDITPCQYDEMAQQYGHVPDKEGLVKQYKHWLNARLLRGAARVVPWSRWAAHSVIHDYGVDPSRVVVIRPGVDLAQWHPATVKLDGPLRILFVGGDLYRKGGDDLLAAFRRLPPGSAELVLVTRTDVAPEAGVTIYRNLQSNSPELVALCQTCHVFALPTKAEAFGIAAVEACALGLPVIATGVGGLSDIVIDGETGLVMPPGNVEILSNHLRLLAENTELRQRLSHGARAHAEAHFDATVNATHLAEILQQVVVQTRIA